MLTVDLELKEILIYDEIGPGWWGLIDANAVDEALRPFKGQHVKARLNTPGGSVDEGINIYNLMKRHPGGITTIVDSLAASMGSYLLQAGERRIVAHNSMVMIHDPWTITFGNSAQLRKDAEVLDKHALRMIPDYAARSGKTDDEILAIMSEESWYAGQEIVDAGFADEIVEDAKALASKPVVAQLHRYAHKIPASLLEAAKRKVAGIKKPGMTVEEARMKAKAIA